MADPERHGAGGAPGVDASSSTAISALATQVILNDRARAASIVSADGCEPSAEEERVVVPGAPSLGAKAAAGLAVLSMPAPPRMAAQSIVLDMLDAGLAGQPAAALTATSGEDEPRAAQVASATTATASAAAAAGGGGSAAAAGGAGVGVGAGSAACASAAASQQQADAFGGDAEHDNGADDDVGAGSGDDDAKSDASGGTQATTGSIVDDIVQQAGVSPSCTLVWYFARRHVADIDRVLEVACRPLSILRPGKDLIALPIGFPVVMELWMWAVERFGYQLWQALWYPLKITTDIHGKAWYDVDLVHKKVVDSVRTMFNGRLLNVLLVPFQKAKQLHALCSAAGVRTFGDTFDGLTIKDCLHPRPWDGAKSVPSTYLRHPKTGDATRILVPRGFTCVNHTELVAAHAALTGAGVERIVLKPSWSSSGDGIVMNVSADQVEAYTWDENRGSVVLEEFLVADVNPSDGRTRWPVVHFLARSQCGEVVEQLIAGTATYKGTVSPCDIETVVGERVQSAAEELAEIFGFSGFWGIDLLVHKGQPYLIDLNSGRPNGGHVPKIFVSLYAPNQPFKFWKERHVSPHLTAKSMHAGILAAGLGFTTDTRRGLIILHVFPGVIATVMAIGRNKKDLAKLLGEWDVHRAGILGEA